MEDMKHEAATRLEKVRRMMERAGVEVLIVNSNPDVRYLSNYNLIVGASIVLVSATDATLLIDQEWDSLRAKEGSFLSRVDAVSDITQGVARAIKGLGSDGGLGVVGWSSFPAPMYLEIKSAFPDALVKDLTESMKEIRMVKSPLEIEWLTRAVKITDEGGNAAAGSIDAGKKENEVALAAEVAMKSAGAAELSFPTVLGSGTRTEIIVPLPTGKKIERGELVLMDMGGRYNGYCGDLSRTKLCGGGNASAKQKEIYNVVMEMHDRAIASVRPGVTAAEIHRISNSVAEEAGYGKFVKHMTGHGIGLEDHEKPILETEETELVPGIVHSIEPGLYVPGVGGVRVEDLILVTESGGKVLSSCDRSLS